MARTQRDTVEYFPHDAHAAAGRSDTVKILQGRYGNNGYAVWFKLLEKLASTNGHYIDCRNPMKWKLLCTYLDTDEQTTVEMLNLLVEMDNLDRKLWELQIIWCQKLVDNISDVYKNRRREPPQKPVITTVNGITTVEINNSTESIDISTDKSKTEESKVKQSKIKKEIKKKEMKKELIPLFEIFWAAYPRKEGKGKAAEAFIDVNPNKELMDTILVSIENQKKSINWIKEDGQFIPLPATWLNQKRWQDELKPAKIGIPFEG